MKQHFYFIQKVQNRNVELATVRELTDIFEKSVPPQNPIPE
ncbi:hypothetical protein [Bacillus thuringiensis]|nr:hypothetical protein [Bacillus thuringiensis]